MTSHTNNSTHSGPAPSPDGPAGEPPNTAAFSIKVSLSLRIAHYGKALLSVPALRTNTVALHEKNLLASGPVSDAGKYTVEEHLDCLLRDRLLSDTQPLLVLGMRNNLVNLRACIIKDGKPHAVEPEHPEQSLRPYYGIGLDPNGRLTVGTALPRQEQSTAWGDFFCAATPVAWDNLTPDELFGRILIESADHSHVFQIPRGAHPQATDETRRIWQRLHDVFVDKLHASEAEAFAAMTSVTQGLPLRREAAYLHQVLGVDGQGNLCCHIAHGALENLGAAVRGMGCARAVCVENSGSIQPTFYPRGAAGAPVPLLRAPNFRPKGRALLVLELNNSAFDTLGDFSNESFATLNTTY